jgi:hypothetical protein
MNKMENTIICRKCGGPHFTIKCGKETINNIIDLEPEEKQDYRTKKSNISRPPRITYRVKISDLPLDMTQEEIMDLTKDWGNVIRAKVIVYDDNAVAYIDFSHKDQAKYFEEAINNTPFEHRVLSVTCL